MTSFISSEIRMEYGGNDYPLALTIDLGKMGKNYPVSVLERNLGEIRKLSEKENNICTRIER